jgi:hypothetical protein
MPRLAIALSGLEQRAVVKLAKVYDCDPGELAAVAVQEMLAAHRRPRKAQPARRRRVASPAPVPPPVAVAPPAASPAPRVYQAKRCPACGKDFTPTGPRSTVCGRCKAEWARSESLDDADYPRRAGASTGVN